MQCLGDLKITRWAVNVLPTLPFYAFGNVAILGDAVSLVLVAIRTVSEPDEKLNAGARHDTISGSRRGTSYRGEFLYTSQ